MYTWTCLHATYMHTQMPFHERMHTSIQYTSYRPTLIHEYICSFPHANMPTCQCACIPHTCTPTCLYLYMNVCLLVYNVLHTYHHLYMNIFVHAHVRTCLHAIVFAGLHVYMQACLPESTCERIRANMKKCPNISMSISIHV